MSESVGLEQIEKRMSYDRKSVFWQLLLGAAIFTYTSFVVSDAIEKCYGELSENNKKPPALQYSKGKGYLRSISQ